jgi:phosphatidylinositol alpha-mannosyltransferase
VDLIVVGDGPGSGLIKRRLPRRLRHRVHFLGCLPRKKLLECYTVSDVFCAPSLGRESFGMVLLEAMAAGLPVVASDIEGYRNIVTHDHDGYLIAPGRPEQWSRTLIDLLDEPDAISRLGRNGQRKALTYRWAAIARKLESIYYESLGPSRRADLEEEALLGAGQMIDAQSPVFQDG